MFDKTSSQKQRLGHVMIVIFIIIAVMVVADLTFFGDNLRMYSKWLECGQKPVEVTSLPGSGMEGYRDAASFEFIRLGHLTFYCSAEQAEAAGYSHL